jgi:anaerobic magnesium-protoporphyrin IX monomethyl ester cyclase
MTPNGLDCANRRGYWSSGPVDRNEIRYLLVNPPLTDPTCPYHSISYLMAAAVDQGFTGGKAVDVNVEALNFMAQPREVDALLELAADVRVTIEAKSSLSRYEQMQYRLALRALAFRSDTVEQAIGVLRDAERFYDYPEYRQAVTVLKRWIEVLTLRGVPGLFEGYRIRGEGPINLSRTADLTNAGYLDEVNRVFAPYLDGPLAATLEAGRFHLVGISVCYLSQLPFALALGRRIRASSPGSMIVYGGTEVMDVLKYQADDEQLWRIFGAADTIVAGEGESALVRILDHLATDTELTSAAGTMVRTEAERACLAPIVYENVDRLPPPRYDIWDWDQYWSPEPVVLYSPTSVLRR